MKINLKLKKIMMSMKDEIHQMQIETALIKQLRLEMEKELERVEIEHLIREAQYYANKSM